MKRVKILDFIISGCILYTKISRVVIFGLVSLVYFSHSLLELHYFKEPLLLEITDNYKKIIVSVIYRSPSQNNSEFNSFLSYLEQLLRDISECKLTVSVITGHFNGRSLSWWSRDINTSEGTKLYSLTSSNGFPQLINESAHIQTNSSSCIDLVFTDQPNLSVNYGAHASLHPYCHHQIVHTKFYY